MKIIKRGAEAIIYLKDNSIVKERVEKKYRIKEIDKVLRKERTRKESKIINDARRIGINVPKIYEVDEEKGIIIMEFIDGLLLKNVLNEMEGKKIKESFYEIGKNVAKLHSANIIHGDLTTSNMILKDDRIYFIDFGLANYSSRIEDKAVDLKLLYESLKSVHFKILNICWEYFLKGYCEENKEYKKVLERLEEIKKRGRYVERRNK
ncbi:MAG: KEOPS complex kinase/ATPase Bud32 [Candidatus Aenigmatarchaeota archaeon]